MEVDKFVDRHIGIQKKDLEVMLDKLDISSLDELINQIIPENIRKTTSMQLPEAMTENAFSEHIAQLAGKNKLVSSYIGMGWYETITPSPILRNILENPVWYTAYTPYQAEISQGRLEALFNFQTLISELTALPLANASLLDEATAAAEAAEMMFSLRSKEKQANKATILLVDEAVYSYTKAVLKTRCISQDIDVQIIDYRSFDFNSNVFGAIVQYPNALGSIEDYNNMISKAKAENCMVAVAADLLSLCILTPPGEWGADIVFGSSQRFGIPMYYGGPSAAFFASKEEYKRFLPGRIIGISKDSHGKPAFRMALQTREQHIKREKATSNICTAQALLATMAGFYAVYHGPEGLKKIASNIHFMASYLAEKMNKLGYIRLNNNFFDTLTYTLPKKVSINVLRQIAESKNINLNYINDNTFSLSINETTTQKNINELVSVFSSAVEKNELSIQQEITENYFFEEKFLRQTSYLQQKVFSEYHSETELMRYIKRLERKDISLIHSMIPLGSCTMKLNAASEMFTLSLSGFRNIHPFAPKEQVQGYTELLANLADYLKEITGLNGVSFQPNSGAAGEYAGLCVIREYFKSKGELKRHYVLIPESAHGTNPASAIQAGFDIISVKCTDKGHVDLHDLQEKARLYQQELAAFMVTYPSTHGTFEADIAEMCKIIHQYGGLVYMDGANMNAQIGLTNPGVIGADVCHLNLHKSFAGPHGGGGPGSGPICVATHLIPFLPQHPMENGTLNTVSASPNGNAGILPITYAYIRMMGAEGLTQASKIAILNANYLAACFSDTFGIVYTDDNGRVGHEMILECRKFKNSTGITETDIAKRLIDYGFHAPTLSFPVSGTLMIEPTESESLNELNRFVEAMLTIYNEIAEIENGIADKTDNVLKNAPHAQYEICANDWLHPYSREKAAFPLDWLRENKFWINVSRIDNAYGDRNLIVKI